MRGFHSSEDLCLSGDLLLHSAWVELEEAGRCSSQIASFSLLTIVSEKFLIAFPGSMVENAGPALIIKAMGHELRIPAL